MARNPHSYYVAKAKADIARDTDKLLMNIFTNIYLTNEEMVELSQSLIFRTKQHVNELSSFYKAKSKE